MHTPANRTYIWCRLRPARRQVTRRKPRFGIWINTDSGSSSECRPTALFSQPAFDAIASPEVQGGSSSANTSVTQRRALRRVVRTTRSQRFVRLRTHGLYREETSAVTFLTPTLFRTSIPLPAEVPIGLYNVEIKLFADGALVTKTDTAFEIVKVGFEQFVATTAQQHGFVYGLVTAFMALMTGWMASIVFRRMSTSLKPIVRVGRTPAIRCARRAAARRLSQSRSSVCSSTARATARPGPARRSRDCATSRAAERSAWLTRSG